MIIDINKQSEIANIVRQLHSHPKSLNNYFLDELFDIRPSQEKFDYQVLNEKYGKEQFNYEGTPYDFIRFIINQLNPKENEVFFDLGAGYGRIVLYGAVCCSSNFIGIEIIPQRIKNAKKTAKKLGLENACFFCGNVSDFDLSIGDYFFLFNPFSDKTLELIGRKLKKLSISKKFTIITWGGPSNNYFKKQNWVKELFFYDQPKELEFFQTKNDIS